MNYSNQLQGKFTFYSCSERNFSSIRSYLQNLKQILLHPILFFQHVCFTQNPFDALSFALITHWIGSMGTFMWGFSSPRDSFLWSFSIESFFHFSPFSQWIQGMSRVILDPFFTLFSILIQNFVLFIGVKVIQTFSKNHSPKSISYLSTLGLLSYSFAPSILYTLPWAHSYLVSIWIFCLTLIGLIKGYSLSLGKAFCMLLLPKISISIIFLFGTFFMFLLALIFPFILHSILSV